MLFRTLAFLGAFLAFWIELAAAKLYLPLFGGSAAVWIVSMMFFQGTLLTAYIYAHEVTARLSRRGGALAHLAVLSAAGMFLPVGAADPSAFSDPALRLLAALFASVGLPFFALSATTPLVQTWLGDSRGDGYHLFGASNAGALLALLAYPLVLEPLLPSFVLMKAWTAVFAGFALLHLACLPRQETAPERSPPGGISPHRKLMWILAAAGPCAMMLAATNHLTNDFAAVPLLWVLPLAVYLLTFVINFSRTPWVFDRTLVAFFSACILLFLIPPLRPIMSTLGKFFFILGTVFAVGMVNHRILAQSRPTGADEATQFYIWVALGGWIGSAAVAVILPLVARTNALAALDWLTAALFASSALIVRDWGKPRTSVFAGALAAAIAAVAAAATVIEASGSRIFALRNFYGVYSVDETDGLRVLHHGNTPHGMQFTDSAQRRSPLAYFHRRSGLGDVFELFNARADAVAVVGLGAGTVAAYGRPGQRMDFYELDPDVKRIAQERFTYLKDCPAEVRVLLGDARLQLEKRPDSSYDILVLDAFNSGAVPVHLLTSEAMALYRRLLKEDGLLLLHVSNRYLDLAALAAAHAQQLGLPGAERTLAAQEAKTQRGLTPSRWAVISKDPAKVEDLVRDRGWKDLAGFASGSRPWNDRQASLLPYLSL